MTSPFLLAYAAALVEALLEDERIEIADGEIASVIGFLASYLEGRGRGGSLISCTVHGLLACPEVVEFYADDDELKEIVDQLEARGRRRLRHG